MYKYIMRPSGPFKKHNTTKAPIKGFFTDLSLFAQIHFLLEYNCRIDRLLSHQ
jgi:hypothetical protein